MKHDILAIHFLEVLAEDLRAARPVPPAAELPASTPALISMLLGFVALITTSGI